MNRLNWDDYFMNIAVQVSLRSTCIRRKVGALLVKDNTIVSTGYNGAPKGLPNCCDDPSRCYRSAHNIPSGEKLDLCYAVHAEVNALMNAIKSGTDLQGATVYVTTFPCSSCAKALMQAGIKKICYLDNYTNEFTLHMIKEAGIECKEMDSSIYRTPDLPEANFKTNNDLDAIDPIVKEIYYAGFEPGTDEFIKNREKVFEKYNLFEKYGDELIYIIDYKMDKELVTGDDVFTEIYNMKKHMDVDYRVNREYNGDKVKQAVVGTVLYNPNLDEFGILEAVSGRLDGKLTMIQGHIAVDKTDIMYAKKDFSYNVNANLMKELSEEVGFWDMPSIFYTTQITGIIQSNDNKISSEHIGFLFITRVLYDEVWEKLSSGEPDKHKFVRISSDDIMKDEVQNNMDTWLKKFINFIMSEKDYYLNE